MLRLVLIFVLGSLQVGFIRPASSLRTIWIVGYDNTGSVPAAEFAAYPELARMAVLERLQPGDEIVLLAVHQGEHAPEIFQVGRRLNSFRQEVQAIADRLRAIPRAKGPHTTDLGQIMDHARRRMELDESLKVGRARYRIVILTDGILGRQQSGREWPSPAQGDWRLLLLGLKDPSGKELRRLAAKAGFRQEDRILGVPFSHAVEATYSLNQFLECPVNPVLLKPPAASLRGREIRR
jgi:hypothetical protein